MSSPWLKFIWPTDQNCWSVLLIETIHFKLTHFSRPLPLSSLLPLLPHHHWMFKKLPLRSPQSLLSIQNCLPYIPILLSCFCLNRIQTRYIDFQEFLFLMLNERIMAPWISVMYITYVAQVKNYDLKNISVDTYCYQEDNQRLPNNLKWRVKFWEEQILTS